MPQRPKAEVRDAILSAAADTFAEQGFQGAKLTDIVVRAGTSIGNLYKYFANKDELFEAFLPPGFEAQLTRLIRARVEALRAETDALSLGPEHPYRHAADELSRFVFEHRERVVFLLCRAEGTAHAGFADATVRLLVRLALHYARAAHPDFEATPSARRALTRIYRAYVATLGVLLQEERSEGALREAVALQTTYHLSGLEALFRRSEPRRIEGERFV
ncbi:MAG: helix-turn-helix domain-containing protein [Polyangiales bacterium]|nr:TetR/AcrR family transcriptional regulator [Myxococcales bacterium]